MAKLKGFDKTLFVITSIALLVITCVAGRYISVFSANVLVDQEKWGQFGDYFGGVLNPILSFFALLGLLFTLRAQHAESRISSDRHLEQQFESRLFQMLTLSHSAVSSIKLVSQTNPPVEFEGHRAIAYALNRLQEEYFKKVPSGESNLMYSKLLPVFNDWKQKYWSAVASYMESMLFLVSYALESAKGEANIKFAIRAVFSQLTADEKLLLFYVMIFSRQEKIFLTSLIMGEFVKGASPDDLFRHRTALVQSAVLARLTP